MKQIQVLVIDDQANSVENVRAAYSGGGILVESMNHGFDAAERLILDQTIQGAVIRYRSATIDGRAICEQTRRYRSADSLPIVVVISSDDSDAASACLQAGASDVIVEPWEPRELRMRLGLPTIPRRRRIDGSHEGTETQTALPGEPLLIRPLLNPLTMQYTHYADRIPLSCEEVERLKSDPRVTEVTLDHVMLCPCCGSIPTVRPGCERCGSGVVARQTHIHHYACACIAAEKDFETEDGLRCPKCRTRGLIPGTDCELAPGAVLCDDCHHVSSDATLIGHCVTCRHRFPIAEARLVRLSGYRVPPLLLARIFRNPEPSSTLQRAHWNDHATDARQFSSAESIAQREFV